MTRRLDVDLFLRHAPPQLSPERERQVTLALYKHREALYERILGSPAGLALIWAHHRIAQHHPRAANRQNADALAKLHDHAAELVRAGRRAEVSVIVGALRPQLRDIRGMERMLLAAADRGRDWIVPASDLRALAVEVRALRRKFDHCVQVMVRHNLRFVVQLVCDKAYPTDDLLQEATLGLWDGAVRFDPAAGAKYSTYAGWWIRKRVARYMDRRRAQEEVGQFEDVAAAPIPAPEPDLETQRLADAYLAELPEDQARALTLRYGLEGPEMTVKEVAAEMGVTTRDVVRVFRATVEA